MKTEQGNNMTAQIDAFMNLLGAHGIKGKIWQRKRIYLQKFGKDITAYITFDDPESFAVPEGLFSGCALKVFTDAGEGKWAYNRRQDVMQEIGAALHRAGITSFAPPENARDMTPCSDED